MDYDLLYKAIYEFTTNIQGELPLFVGDVVKFENSVDEDWWYGYKVNDKASPAGIFPSVFVAKLDLSVPLKKFKSIWVASDDFLGQHDGDLNLLRGDFIIDVRRVDADWLEGRSGFNFAKRGIFPANFACQLPPPLLSQKEVIFSRGDRVDGIFIQQDSFGRKHSDVRARVICDLEAKLPGEISLVTGEIVYIESSVDETFFSGRTENGSTHGIFPKRFVEICDDKALLIDYRKLDSMPKDIATTSFNDICSSPKSTRKNRSSSRIDMFQKESNGREDHRNNYSSNYSESYGYTKFEFIPQYREELGFKANQKIRLIKHVDHEWILGEICNTKGIFPASYVDIKIDCPWMKVRNNDLKKPEINDSDISKPPTYQAVYDFPGMVEGDLQTATGDFVQLLNKIDDCWIEAKNSRTLKIGMIPLSFLKKCGSDEICFRESNNRIGRPASWNCDSSSEQAASSKHSSLKHRVSIPDTALEVQNEIRMKHNEEAEKKKADLRSQRTHIFEEIIHSENDYINDLTICVQIFHESKHELDVIALLAGFPEIIALSKKLVQTLDEEHEKDFVYQEIGNAFLNLQDEFKDVYADFCQTHESTQKLLDDASASIIRYSQENADLHRKDFTQSVTRNKYGKDPQKQQVLVQILTAIQNRTVCLDLKTMLSRPVQRVLKYPLFISELLKCTEDNSSDKVKLLMALKVMTEVAQCINESKRRKDLVLKYRKEEESNLSSRLSKINIHTLRKKSNRLSMRLSTSIGLVQTIKDQEFDALEKQFKTLEKACRTLLKDLQSYCTQTLNFYNVQLSIAEDLLCLMDSNSSQSRRFCDTLSEILSNDMQAFFDSVNSKVRDPILVIQQTFQGPENLIAKRYDKLLDYESSLSKQMKEKNRADCTDMSKLRLLNEDVRKCKAEYEALNVQLIGELPHLLSGANDILSITTKAFVGAQRAFIYSSSERLAALNNPSLSLSNYTCDVKRSVADNATSISTLLHKKQPIISRKSSGSTISSGDDTKYAEEISLCPKQTNNQKKALIAKYQMNKIFKAKSAYKPMKEMDLSLDLDDIVAVIINKDPTGDSQRWFVDNGVNKGFVPQANLRLYSATSTPDESQKSDSLLPLVSIISDAETPGKDLFLRPTRLAPPIPKSPHLPKFRLGNNISHPPQDSHGKTAGNHPSPQQQPDMEFFVASFDYKPTSSNEVALETGLLVAVHAKHDLQMNTEWWLVENEQGDIGYVPANYLAPV